MSALTLSLIIFGLMLLLMAVRTPIAIAMFGAGTIGYLMQSGWGAYSNFLNTQAFARFASYDLSVIPLFILMGHFATQGGISRALFQFAASVMGRFKGGLAMAAVLASAAFGSICGSSVATAATITGVALPEMKRHGYSGRISTGTLAAGGTLGILIPPSVPLVIYAILAEQNIAKLFAAAMVPGIIAMVGYMIAIGIYVRIVPGQAPDSEEREPFNMQAMMGILPIATVFLIVFGGIYGGFFTPTEGAAVGAAATFVAALAKREITWEKFKHCFYDTAISSAMIFLIFIGADVMNASLALTQVPAQLAEVVGGWGLPPLMVVTAIMLFYVVLGAVMDELSMILLTIPIFFPVIMGLDFYGLDQTEKAIWFGILALMVVEIGMVTPPLGMNVYVIAGMARDIPMSEVFRGIVPVLISDIVRVVILVLFPSITLCLVRWLT